MGKNRTNAIALVLIICMLLTGCGKKEPLPETTGAELGVYVLDGKFVDENAEEILENGVPVYRFDEDGNIVTKDEKKDVVVIAAKNAADFTCINEAVIEEKDAKQNIPLYVLSDGSEVYGTVTWEMPVNIVPANAVNSKITVETADENTLYFNAGESKLEFDGTEPIVLKITGCYSGDTKIFIANCLGEVIKTIDISLTGIKSADAVAIAEIEAKIANCNHEYVSEVVPSTETSEGYTIHTCSKCGHTYRDAYTEKLPCSHTFTEREVKATCTEKGYTLCTCTKCGFTEKKDYTELAEHTYRDNVVAPTCKAEGYTEHICTICGHKEIDSRTPKADHKYTKTEVVQPTCSAQGYTKHICEYCGEFYTDTTTPMKDHTYQVSVVNPTYMERGYTLHSCTVCGYSYKDAYTEKLVCTTHHYTETRRTEATCTSPGSILKTCSTCGATTTETIPALGHLYSDTVVSPTCTEGGCTNHVCTRCGFSFSDCQIGALGHDMHQHSVEEVIGSEMHIFCNACGLDFTATGVDINSHCKAHALAGEASGYHTNSVAIYGTVIYEECSRCGYSRKVS